MDSDRPALKDPLSVDAISWGPASAIKAGDPPLLKSLSLRVPSGSWVALTGPSGVGKTTFLSLCAGLLRPLEGEISLLGKPLSTMVDSEQSLLRSAELGLIFQNYQLDDSRTTLDNILLPAYFSQSVWKDLRDRALSLATQMGLGDHTDKPASVLSGGQRQRVAVARALLNQPSLILADEPTGALDKETAQKVLDVLAEQVTSGTSLLVVTHDPQVLERAELVYRFHSGKLELVGDE